jgi:hypothetical protein
MFTPEQSARSILKFRSSPAKNKVRGVADVQRCEAPARSASIFFDFP